MIAVPAPVGQIGTVEALDTYQRRTGETASDAGEWLLAELAARHLDAYCQDMRLPASYWDEPVAWETLHTGCVVRWGWDPGAENGLNELNPFPGGMSYYDVEAGSVVQNWQAVASDPWKSFYGHPCFIDEETFKARLDLKLGAPQSDKTLTERLHAQLADIGWREPADGWAVFEKDFAASNDSSRASVSRIRRRLLEEHKADK